MTLITCKDHYHNGSISIFLITIATNIFNFFNTKSILATSRKISPLSGEERKEVGKKRRSKKELRIRQEKRMIPRDNFQERTSLSDMDYLWRGITLLKGAEGNIGP